MIVVLEAANYFVMFVLALVGLFLLLSAILKLPSFKTRTAARQFSRNGRQSGGLDDIVLAVAVHFERFIPINEHKREFLTRALRSVGDNRSPELFTAFAVVKGLVFSLIGIPLLLIAPPLSLLGVLLGLSIYFKETRKPNEIIKERREAIERDLPRFAGTLEQEIKASRNVLKIMEVYAQNTNAAFGNELAITVADMRSGNAEHALTRLDARIGSGQLSEVTRALQGALRGDRNSELFAALSREFRVKALGQLELQAEQRPKKIGKYTLALIIVMLGLYAVALGTELIRSAGQLGF
ncbi:hypothetical protein FACS189425_07560 [Clostridia bacterium]|nr:hypothetical protein FACS189425_07560 [Clostridia bacterium]